jgi:hypothetical protein
MKFIILTWLNIAASLSLGIFFYVMLPFAHGEINYLKEKKGIPYEPLGVFEHIFLAMIPIVIGLTLVLVAKVLRHTKPKISLALVSVFPLLVIVWISFLVFYAFT